MFPLLNATTLVHVSVAYLHPNISRMLHAFLECYMQHSPTFLWTRDHAHASIGNHVHSLYSLGLLSDLSCLSYAFHVSPCHAHSNKVRTTSHIRTYCPGLSTKHGVFDKSQVGGVLHIVISFVSGGWRSPSCWELIPQIRKERLNLSCCWWPE